MCSGFEGFKGPLGLWAASLRSSKSQKERLLPCRVLPIELHKLIVTVSPLIFQNKKAQDFELVYK